MHWQDLAISIAQWVSIIALIPSIIGAHKPALSSALLTAACMAVYATSYMTLGFGMSTFSAALLLLAWLVLAYQQWHIVRARRADTM